VSDSEEGDLVITEFHLMIRRRLKTGLTPWIERARASLIATDPDSSVGWAGQEDNI
jgi:hypothetical protein